MQIKSNYVLSAVWGVVSLTCLGHGIYDISQQYKTQEKLRESVYLQENVSQQVIDKANEMAKINANQDKLNLICDFGVAGLSGIAALVFLKPSKEKIN